MTDDAPINRGLQAGDWFKLALGNDWGFEYLARDPYDRHPCVIHLGLTGRTRNGWSCTARAGRAYRLEAGETITVRLKDGSQRTGTVSFRTSTQVVGDMGKTYSVSSALPFVSFPDGTEVSLLVAEIQYDPERDPAP